MGLFKRILLLQDENPAEEEETVEEPVDAGTYWIVQVTLIGGGKRRLSYKWMFGREEKTETAASEAIAFARQLIGDGIGIYDDGQVLIQKQHIVMIELAEYNR